MIYITDEELDFNGKLGHSIAEVEVVKLTQLTNGNTRANVWIIDLHFQDYRALIGFAFLAHAYQTMISKSTK